MRHVPYSQYLLPAGGGRKERVSSWRMNPTEAAALGAIRPVGEPEWREIPETEEERRQLYTAHPSPGRDSVKHFGAR